ncbi:MAG: glycosyltransferase family 2 protein [Saprospiraceae bacterium]|nr:glycosyltransferase family 2 protein [Saprospiraceae bacterium]
MFQILRNLLNPKADEVTICIPAYNAANFIEETIQSAAEQSHGSIQILISLDKSNDDTFRVLQKNRLGKLLKTYQQEQRLGWVANTNFLLNRVRTRYFMILPHDDLVDKEYIKKLLEDLKQSPQAIAAFSDIEGFGNRQNIITQSSIIGSTYERIKDYLLSHYNAVVFRALIDRHKMRRKILLAANQSGDFAEDTVFGFNLSLHGDLIRHPEILYKKRYHDLSYHAQWQKWPVDIMLEAWTMHCIQLLTILKDAGYAHKYRTEIQEWVMDRLCQRKTNLWQRPILSEYLNDEHMIHRINHQVVQILDN